MTWPSPKEWILLIGWAVLTMAYFIAMSIWARTFSTHPAVIITILIGLVITTIATVVTAGFLKSRWLVAIFMAVAVLTTALAGRLQWGAMFGGLFFSLILLQAHNHLHWELTSRTRYKPFRIFTKPSRTVLLAILVALLGVSQPAIFDRFTGEGSKLTSEHVRPFLVPALPLVQQVLPSFTIDMTVGEYVDQELQANLESELKNISPEIIAVSGTPTITSRQRAEVLDNLSNQFGVPLTGEETLSDLTAAIGNKKIAEFGDQGPILLTIIILLIVLLTVRAIIPIVAVPAVAGIMGLIYIARTTKFIVLSEQSVLAERLELNNSKSNV